MTAAGRVSIGAARGVRSARALWLVAPFLVVCLAEPPAGIAQPNADLYQATTIVTGTDMRSRPWGFAQAFRKVLVTVSGEPRLQDDPRVGALAAHADTLVTSFSYVDRMAGRPVHDEQGTRDRPYNLTVHFDPAGIDKMLAMLGERPWRGPRPVIVPFVIVRGLRTSYLLSAEGATGAEQRSAFADVAHDFGIAVRFPTEDELARRRVVPGRFPVPQGTFSEGEAAVAGTLDFEEALPGWVGAWRLTWRGAGYAWGIKGVNFDQAFRDLVRGVVRVASGHGTP